LDTTFSEGQLRRCGNVSASETMEIAQASASFPLLREDLVLHQAGEDIARGRGLVLEDRLRGLYFRLPAAAADIIRYWNLGTAEKIAQSAGTDVGNVQELAQFFSMNRLLIEPVAGVGSLIGEHVARRRSHYDSAVHSYLFFRIPLFDPTTMLDRLLPLARYLVSWPVIAVICLLGVTGFYFATRQWDKFATTLVSFTTPGGLLIHALTLVGLKVFHELGHGLVARAFRCRVDMMGIAFMVLAPMLYTEINDAWRLRDRRQRLLIAAAGVLTEFALAALALFAWAFLPDGVLRSTAYFVAVTAVVASLVVNLSPFMRFDGYHMLADALGLYNLGPRAFKLANWKVRQLLFGVEEEAPELLSQRLRRFMIAFAWATMLYRLLLFFGIALLVYHLFPKIIGIAAASIEIAYFIVLPVVREVGSWNMRRLISTRRFLMNAGLAALVILGLLLPLDRHAHVPAILVPQQEAWLYPPESALISKVLVQHGQKVRKDDLLFVLYSDELEYQLATARMRLDLVAARLRRAAGDPMERAQRGVLEREFAVLGDEIAGLVARADRLQVRSPSDGWISEIPDGLSTGVSVGVEDLLAHVAGAGAFKVEGLAAEAEALRLKNGATGVFVAESGMYPPVDVLLQDVGTPGAFGARQQYLSSLAGGPVLMERLPDGDVKSVGAVLPVTFKTDATDFRQVVRGTVSVDAEPVSFASIVLRRVASVALRESGF
jgi:putative peptide zinc metalloprotease protein